MSSLEWSRSGGDAPDHEIAVCPETKIERVAQFACEQHDPDNLVLDCAFAEKGPAAAPIVPADQPDTVSSEWRGNRDPVTGSNIH